LSYAGSNDHPISHRGRVKVKLIDHLQRKVNGSCAVLQNQSGFEFLMRKTRFDGRNIAVGANAIAYYHRHTGPDATQWSSAPNLLKRAVLNRRLN
jgi:hypothetical protein